MSNHPIPPERIRAEAERVVNEFAALKSYNALWRMHHPDNQARFIECVAAGASLVDVATVQREAARKAWDARTAWGCETSFGESPEQARDRYLAREHPAPAPRECVLSDGSVVTYRFAKGEGFPHRFTRQDGPQRYIEANCDALDDAIDDIMCDMDTIADRKKVKSFAERSK